MYGFVGAYGRPTRIQEFLKFSSKFKDKGITILFKLGFCNYIKFKIIRGVFAQVLNAKTLRLYSTDLARLSLTCNHIFKLRALENYNAKGIRYKGHHFIIKVGKK